MSADLHVNPYRFRARDGDGLLFGVLPGRRTQSDPALLAILSGGVVNADMVAGAGADWLMDENFVIANPLRTDHRYASQIGFFTFWPGDFRERQEMLARASVGILGLGSLGSQVAWLLAAAGVGRLLLCDRDDVESSNLNRQVVYEEADVGRPKVEAAAERLKAVNAHVRIEAYRRELLDQHQIADTIDGVDVVVRAIDAPAGIAFEVDRACRRLGVPSVGGGFLERWAVAGPFLTPEGLCLRCVSAPPPEVAESRRVATFGPLTFWLSSYVAGDVMRYLTGLGEPWLEGRTILLDGASGEIVDRHLDPLPGRCPGCGIVHPAPPRKSHSVASSTRTAVTAPRSRGESPARTGTETMRSGMGAVPVALAGLCLGALVIHASAPVRLLGLAGEVAVAILGTAAVRPRSWTNGYLWGVAWALGLVTTALGSLLQSGPSLLGGPLGAAGVLLLGLPVDVLLVSSLGLAAALATARWRGLSRQREPPAPEQAESVT